MMSAATVYLAAARHARLCALACPDDAHVYKARARYWLAHGRCSTPSEGAKTPLI